MKNIAVIFSGCGYKNGTEITEGVSVLLALSELGAKVRVFAPHAWMEESAKISRDQISSLNELHANEFDGLVLPGGFGAAKNLSDWASKGASCTVDSDVVRVLREFYEQEKPIAAACIAPTLIAKVLGQNGVTLTIGNDEATAAEIVKTGAHHEVCAVDDFVTDREHRVITTPAYMYGDASAFQVYTGIRKALAEMVEMA